MATFAEQLAGTVATLDRLRQAAVDGSGADVAEVAYALLAEVYGEGWAGSDPEQPIDRDAIVEALRDAHRNDSAADAVEFVSDLVGWSAEDDPELQAEAAAEQAERDRATCSICLARTYRGEECVCPDGGDYEELGT